METKFTKLTAEAIRLENGLRRCQNETRETSSSIVRKHSKTREKIWSDAISRLMSANGYYSN